MAPVTAEPEISDAFSDKLLRPLPKHIGTRLLPPVADEGSISSVHVLVRVWPFVVAHHSKVVIPILKDRDDYPVSKPFRPRS